MAVPPPSHAPSRPEKPALRRALRLARLRFAGRDDLQAMTATLCERLLARCAGAATVSGYVAHRGEPDIAAVLSAVIGRGGSVALPHVGEGIMRFVGWSSGQALAAGPLGIAQPAPGPGIVPDVALVPLLGFDRAGNRLGQGAGYYDRWFAEHPSVRRIGVAWSVQAVDALPCDPWDVKLHAIATEQDWIEP